MIFISKFWLEHIHFNEKDTCPKLTVFTEECNVGMSCNPIIDYFYN
jgi:hypothetical protein